MKDKLYHIAKRIEIGGRDYQQDFAGMVDTPFGSIILVADGMGGHEGGEIAAEIAIRSIIDNFKQNSNTEPSLIVKDSIFKAHQNILKIAQENTLLNGMGTTIAVLHLSDKYAQAFHVGDSRIYWIRKGQILYRSDDDTDVYKKYLANQITLEEARTHPQSNILEQALGTLSLLRINESPVFFYEKGDHFLLCSDGLWGSSKEELIVNNINDDSNLNNIANQLVNLANNAGIISGGKHDNITTILVRTMYNSKAINKSILRIIFINLTILMSVVVIAISIYKNQNHIINNQQLLLDSLNKVISKRIEVPHDYTANDSVNQAQTQKILNSIETNTTSKISKFDPVNPKKNKQATKNNKSEKSIDSLIIKLIDTTKIHNNKSLINDSINKSNVNKDTINNSKANKDSLDNL